MKKLLNLVFISTFFMYSCNEPKTDASFNITKPHERSHGRSEVNQTQIVNDHQKYHSLKKVIEEGTKKFISARTEQVTEFFTWLESNPQKQKEITDAFSPIYDFLDNKRQKLASHMTFEEYIIDGSTRFKYDNYNNQYGPIMIENTYNNYVSCLIDEFDDPIVDQAFSTNEERFEALKKRLVEGRTEKYPHETLKGWD